MTSDKDKYIFLTSTEARETILYSPDRAQVEAATQFLKNVDRATERLATARNAQLELGQYYMPLRHAQGTDAIVASLRILAKQYSWSFKPKEVVVWFRTLMYLRQLKK